MNVPVSLKRKYSWGPIPQWELDALQPEVKKPGTEPKKIAKVKNGDVSSDRDQGA